MTVVTDPIHQPRNVPQWRAEEAAARAAAQQAAPQAAAALTARGERSIAPQNVVQIGWKDVIDAINPLQQLPVVGEIYRGVTGETISGMSRVAGGFIFGGIAGGLVAALTAAYAEAHNDQGPAEQLVAWIAGREDAAEPAADEGETMLAETGATADALAKSGAAAVKNGAGLGAGTDGAVDAIPTITIRPADTARTSAAASDSRSAQFAVAEKPAEAAAAMPSASLLPPLRDRLNQKKATPGFSDSKHPLSLTGFIDRMPANAAALTAARQQNLELLQGIDAAKPAANPLPGTGEPAQVVAEGVTGGRNPLPADLVRDMMMQALDKYQQLPSHGALPPVVTETE